MLQQWFQGLRSCHGETSVGHSSSDSDDSSDCPQDVADPEALESGRPPQPQPQHSSGDQGVFSPGSTLFSADGCSQCFSPGRQESGSDGNQSEPPPNVMQEVRLLMTLLSPSEYTSEHPTKTPQSMSHARAAGHAAFAASIEAAGRTARLDRSFPVRQNYITSFVRQHCGSCSLSFRVAVLFVIGTVVLLSSVSIFIPLEAALEFVGTTTAKSCEDSVHLQHDLISSLIYDNLTQSALRDLLSSTDRMVSRFVSEPAMRAVDSLWESMATMRHMNPSWDGKAPSERDFIARHAWLQLKGFWTRPAPDVTGFQWRDTGGPHPNAIYVSFMSEQFAGASTQANASCETVGELAAVSLLMDAPGGISGESTTLSAYSVLDKSLVQPLASPFQPSQRAYFKLQAAFAAEATAHAGGAAGLPLQQAWSEIYFWPRVGFGFTYALPIAYCGDYSCFEGVVAADQSLSHVYRDCADRWGQLQAELLLPRYNFSIDYSNSGVFIVNQLAKRSPEQQGFLVASSHADYSRGSSQDADINGPVTLSMAMDTENQIVRGTARVLLALFGTWQNSSLQTEEHTFTFSLAAALGEPAVLQQCVHNGLRLKRNDVLGMGAADDCLRVGTRSARLDPGLRWLIVAVLPAGAFSRQVDETASTVARQVEHIQDRTDARVWQARAIGVSVFGFTWGLSMCLACLLGYLVTQPLKKLSRLMRRLGDLDFAHDSAEHTKLKSGQRARLREVGQLQTAFCRLSRGIEAFARFVPDSVVKSIVSGDETATDLHMERKEVTIMFSDIAGFTGIAEKLSQRDLLYLLTRYFSIMIRIIEHYEGVVAEILGDGLLVFWNTPDDVEFHAGKACAAAVAQQQALAPFNAELGRLGLPSIEIRIGINTGVVLTGNFGSEMKMKFGCMGDPVNLASRLESLCKHYGVSTIVSEATHALLPKDANFFCRKLDLVRVKGRGEATLIYELMGQDAIHLPAVRSPSSSLSDHSFGSSRFKDPAEVAQEAMLSSQQSLKDTYAPSNSFWHPLRRWMSTRQTTQGSQGNATLSTPVPSEASDVAGMGPATISESQRRLALHYEKALLAYQAGSFLEAQSLAQSLLLEHEDDLATRDLLARARRYIGPDGRFMGLSPTELASWRGINNMIEK
eukprot:CAMPEP_0115048274 /NCGR_PEP_ID=MMETSP0227-20121206/469_1 /TAXON_ID=89957 /ORGANISM="Polarella glacialis, Strain CCMP 1383" /LENGTH=1136 /DNA_ID=CAMNT_0002431663 /DNA_START=66 /DNA_END=3476 /DNA_ORIENTATION=+